MPTSKQRRKRGTYLRRGVDTRAQNRALGSERELDAGQQRDLSLPPRAALVAIRNGVGTIEHFGDLAATVNVTLICGERIGKQSESVALDARDALWQVRQRFDRVGRWGFGAGELEALGASLDLYESILQHITAGQYRAAVQEYKRRVDAGEHLGKGTA